MSEHENGGQEVERKARRLLLRDPETRGNYVNGDGPGLITPNGKQDAVVIDLGSSEVRAGFASEKSPKLRFPPLVSRARDAGADGRRRNYVGYDALHTSVRSGARSPFELNIGVNSTLVERLLDGAVTMLGLDNDLKIDRPFVVTEPVCQMNSARSIIMEVLFEGYQANGVCLGIDSLFSFLQNSKRSDGVGFSNSDALVLSCGYKSTHVLPIINSKLCASAAKRINVGGEQATSTLAQRLRLLYPLFTPSFSYDRLTTLREQTCYFSENYGRELEVMMTDPDYFEKSEIIVELPIVDTSKAGPTPEEIERQKKVRAESGKRLHSMMAARRQAKGAQEEAKNTAVEDKLSEEEQNKLHSLLLGLGELESIADLQYVDEDDHYLGMARRGFRQRKDLEKAIEDAKAEIEKFKENVGEERFETAEKAWKKKQVEDALLDTPDALLSAPSIKEKKKIKSIRGAAEARQRIREQKEEERKKIEAAEAEAERHKREDPEGYLNMKIKERDNLAQKMKRRRAAREAGSDRRSQAARNKMRLLAQQMMPEMNGKKQVDDFGAKDEDWNVYHDIQGADSEEEQNDEIELANIKGEIAELAPHLAAEEDAEPRGAEKLYYPVERQNEFDLCIDRIRSTEPNIVGLDQCGLGECIGLSLDTLPGGSSTKANVVKEIFLTGGMMGTPGARERTQFEVRQLLPADLYPHGNLNIRVAADPVLDAWRGAALFARAGEGAFTDALVTRAEYDEMGPEYLKEHVASNLYYQRPIDPDRDTNKRKR